MPDDPIEPGTVPGGSDSHRRVMPVDEDAPTIVGDAAETILMGESMRVRSGDQSSAVIGRYKLLRELGKGGFGVVWHAEQTEPIHREVALKIIKPGMDSDEIIARFAAEQQALALMDHPNIASVLDAGTTDSGRPYFVMELVKGVSITEYCDAHQLDVRARIEVFIPVCQAVQHAHQKSILHRDLKPSNILVTEVDGKPVPKVIDFGIAKALGTSMDAAFRASLMQTQAGMVIGTPQYMSPEQAGSVPDVDTRSDIYTLGVILHELLTGQTPLNLEQVRHSALDEILRQVREGVSKRPSSRLAPATEAVRVLAANRNSDPKRLSASLRGDLDWIILKAVEKERERRYETVNALAKDLQRSLDCEPVSAGPPSATYRLRKLVRRNRLAFGAALGVGLALVAGIVTSTWQAIRAREAEHLAGERFQQAERARDAAENLIGDAIFGLRDKLMPIGKLTVLDGMQKAAEGYYADLPPELASSTTRHHQVRLALNRALIAAARSDDDATEEAAQTALGMARKLSATHPDDFRFVDDLTFALITLSLLRTLQDAPEEARAYGDEACQLADEWLKRAPQAPEPRYVKLNAYAQRMIALGDSQDAISPDVLPTFATMRELSDQLKALGRASIETATVDAMGTLGNALVTKKLTSAKVAAPAFREAEAAFTKALETYGEHPFTRQMFLIARGYTVGNLQAIAEQTKDPALRSETDRQRFEIVREREKLTELEPLRLDWWKQLATSYSQIAELVDKSDGPAAALEWAEKAYVTGEKAVSPSCDRVRVRRMRVNNNVILVRLLQKIRPEGWAQRSVPLLRDAMSLKLAPIKHGQFTYDWSERESGRLWWEITMELDQPARSTETLQAFRDLLTYKRAFIATVTTDAKPLRDGIEAASRVAEFLQRQGRPAEATEFLRLKDEWRQDLMSRFTDDREVVRDRLKETAERCGKQLDEIRNGGSPKETLLANLETQIHDAREFLKKYRARISNDDAQRYQGIIENLAGLTLLEGKKYAEAEAALRAALEVRNEAATKAQDARDLAARQWDATDTALMLGLAVYKQGRVEDGRQLRRDAALSREKITREQPTPNRYRDTGTAWRYTADLLETPDVAEERVKLLEKAVAVSREAMRLTKVETGANLADVDTTRSILSWSLLNLAIRQRERKQLTEAEANLREGLAVGLSRAASSTTEPQRTRQIAVLRYDLAKTLLELQRPAEVQSEVEAIAAEIQKIEPPGGQPLPIFDEARRRIEELKARISSNPPK